jgi:hypothetical protein
VDGIDVQIRFAEIESAKDVYSVRVYGANSDLFATLGDLKLQDLDLTEYDHYWEMGNIVASRLNTEGYIYSLIDYHQDSPNFACNNDSANLRVDYLLPSFFANTVLAKIFESAGYELNNEVETDSENLLVASSVRPESSLTINDRYNGRFSQTYDFKIDGIGAEYFFEFEEVVNTYGDYWQLPNTVTYIPNGTVFGLRFQDPVKIKVTIELEFRNDFGVSKNVFTTLSFANGFTLIPGTNTTDYTETINVLPGLNSYQVEYEMELPSDAGFIFKLTSDVLVATPSVYLLKESVITITTISATDVRPMNYGDFLSANKILPDFTQTQFLKNYMLLFGLIPIVDESERIVYLKSFDSITSNLHLAYDWSDKIDYSEPHEVKFLLNDYAQKNNLKWAEDGNEPIPVNANGIIEISNNNLELEKDIVEMDFAPTNTNFRLNGLGVGDRMLPQIGIFELADWTNDKVPRLLQLTKKTAAEWGLSVLGMQYDDNVPANSTGVADNIPVCHFIDIAESFNLGFGNNIIQNYYGSIAAIIGKLKVVRELVRLNAADLSDIDFTRPVWIQKHEAYFYISSIKGFSYTENKSTIVELVKLNING